MLAQAGFPWPIVSQPKKKVRVCKSQSCTWKEQNDIETKSPSLWFWNCPFWGIEVYGTLPDEWIQLGTSLGHYMYTRQGLPCLTESWQRRGRIKMAARVPSRSLQQHVRHKDYCLFFSLFPQRSHPRHVRIWTDSMCDMTFAQDSEVLLYSIQLQYVAAMSCSIL